MEYDYILDTGCTNHFNAQLALTLNYSAIADLHTLKITTAFSKSSSLVVAC
jgi:hypothetical protein